MKLTVRYKGTSFTQEVDEQEVYKMLDDWGDQVADRDAYICDVSIPAARISELNGSHILFGQWECLTQSDECPSFVYEADADDLILEWEGPRRAWVNIYGDGEPEKTDEKKEALSSKPREELSKLAMDIAGNRVFIDRFVRSFDELPIVFMPVALGALAEIKIGGDTGLGMMYQYYDDSSRLGRDVNGMPTFCAVHLLNGADAKWVMEKATNIQKAMEDAARE